MSFMEMLNIFYVLSIIIIDVQSLQVPLYLKTELLTERDYIHGWHKNAPTLSKCLMYTQVHAYACCGVRRAGGNGGEWRDARACVEVERSGWRRRGVGGGGEEQGGGEEWVEVEGLWW
jgi:hypothetical protein